MIYLTDNVQEALEKIAYEEKAHRAFAGRMASPKLGFGKSMRKAIQEGSVRVDTGVTKPEVNPLTFSRAHAASNVPGVQIGKQLYQLQQEAANTLAGGAIALHKGNPKKASRMLGQSAATVGRANHTLVDRQAHTKRPKLKGYASPLRKGPGFPTKGFVVAAHEHLISDNPKGGVLPPVKEKLLGLSKGKGVSGDGHDIDRIVGDVSDKRALRQSDRFGRVYIKKARRKVMAELGVSSKEATEIINNAIMSDITPRSVQMGQLRQDFRTTVGELKHRVKSPGRRLRRFLR